ncbi:aspartate/glutamate racemase family protein [Patescibacteria group bacterium]
MKIKNKKIGIIGGVGPQATEVLYRKIIELAQEKYEAKNNNDFPRILIESVPVPDFISDTEKINEAKEMLIDATKALTKAGVTKICVASNTVHLLLDDLKNETEVEFISMVELVAEKCVQLDFKKVGLLGSPVTLNSGLYNKELEKYGVEVVLPTDNQKVIIDKIIRYVLAGQSNDNERQEYIGILNSLFAKGADGVILACTELPLAINYEALGNRIINSIDVLTEGLLDYYYTD